MLVCSFAKGHALEAWQERERGAGAYGVSAIVTLFVLEKYGYCERRKCAAREGRGSAHGAKEDM